MPDPEAVEYVSARLDQSELEAIWNGLPGALQEIVGETILTVRYGWGCEIHPDLWYKDMAVGSVWLASFLRESATQRICTPGESDLYIALPDLGVTVLLCHETDVHLTAASESSVLRLLNHPAFDALIPKRRFARRAAPSSTSS